MSSIRTPEPAVEIDPRLDAERHAGLEHRRVLFLGVRRLVHLESDPVPGAMEEALAVAGGLDHRSRGPIDLPDRDPGAHDGPRGRLRLPHDGMDLGYAGARGSPTESVRVVSLQYPSSTPPKSSTTASPGSIVRAVGS